jgi:hypothetical protein
MKVAVQRCAIQHYRGSPGVYDYTPANPGLNLPATEVRYSTNKENPVGI